MDCFSLLVGLRSEGGMSFSPGPPNKARDLCPSVLLDLQTEMTMCLKSPGAL